MKKSKLQKVMHAVVAALLSLITIFSTTVGAFAWTVDGSGVASGGGGKATNKGYSIPSEFTKSPMRIAGARFSVYNKYSGETLGTIDVFRNTPSGANYITAEKFSVKLNKIQLKKVYNKQSFNTTTSQANCYQASAVAKNLPAYASDMKDWEAEPDNFKGILSKILGGNANINALSPGDMILIEPLFPLKAHGTTFVLTPTEVAILGAQEFGGWDSTGPSTSQEGTWGYISHYTNVFYPQAMFLDTTSLPEELPTGWVLHSGGGKVTNAEHASFRTIIEKGFGVHIAYENTQPKWEPPTIETSFENYNFTVIGELYDIDGNLVAVSPTDKFKKVKTFTNTKTTITNNGQTNTLYIPYTHTFSTFVKSRAKIKLRRKKVSGMQRIAKWQVIVFYIQIGYADLIDNKIIIRFFVCIFSFIILMTVYKIKSIKKMYESEEWMFDPENTISLKEIKWYKNLISIFVKLTKRVFQIIKEKAKKTEHINSKYTEN